MDDIKRYPTDGEKIIVVVKANNGIVKEYKLDSIMMIGMNKDNYEKDKKGISRAVVEGFECGTDAEVATALLAWVKCQKKNYEIFLSVSRAMLAEHMGISPFNKGDKMNPINN